MGRLEGHSRTCLSDALGNVTDAAGYPVASSDHLHAVCNTGSMGVFPMGGSTWAFSWGRAGPLADRERRMGIRRKYKQDS